LIRLAEKGDINTVFRFCENSATGCRISASLSAYGTETVFHHVWLCYDELDNLTGVIGKTNGGVTVCCKNDRLPNEIFEFITMLPDVSEIVYEKNNSYNIVMRFNGTENQIKHNQDVKKGTARDICYVLKNSDNTEVVANDELYVDLSHRIRHGCLIAKMVYIGENPVSCACAHIAQGDALITAVETIPMYRKRGIASSVLAELCYALKDKNIFLMCKAELEEFYKKIGFEKCGGYIIESAVF